MCGLAACFMDGDESTWWHGTVCVTAAMLNTAGGPAAATKAGLLLAHVVVNQL